MSSTTPSPSQHTLVEPHDSTQLPSCPSSTSIPFEADKEDTKPGPLRPFPTPTPASADPEGPKPKLSQRKKWSLLAIFSLAFIIDCANNAAMYIFTGPICRDLDIVVEQNSWVIGAYSITFAAFLLFWGRMSDIFSAKAVFCYGFVALGSINLLISFLPDKYSFLVFRAISGIAAGAVIPASYRLIVMVFEPEELGKALTLFGMSGALAAIMGSLAGGLIVWIPGTGQMIGWRWLFRIMAAVILPVALGSLYWIPAPPPTKPVAHIIRRLDIVGSVTMLIAIVLLILGITLGATLGWRTPHFLVPFLLSFLAFPLFFIWEARVPFDYAVLPPSAWRIPNFTVFVIFALYCYAYVAFVNLPLIETFTTAHGDSSFVAAVRIMPLCVAATAASIFLTVYPKYVASPRWPITLGVILETIASVLFLSANGADGDNYWKFVLPGLLVGGAGVLTVNTSVSVGIISTVPPEMAGVAGAALQVSSQIGQVVALAIQAGLSTIQPGNFTNWVNVRAMYIFAAAWGVAWLVGFLVFYRPAKSKVVEKSGAEGKEGQEGA